MVGYADTKIEKLKGSNTLLSVKSQGRGGMLRGAAHTTRFLLESLPPNNVDNNWVSWVNADAAKKP